jgi:hypothetical protein
MIFMSMKNTKTQEGERYNTSTEKKNLHLNSAREEVHG